jgi:hypothetical protein
MSGDVDEPVTELSFHAGYEQGTSAHGYSSVDARMLVRVGRTGIAIFHAQAEDRYLGIDFPRNRVEFI